MSRDLDYELALPNPASLIQSLRAFGYDISTAIADLIDNSITANSSRIDVVFDWNDAKPWIAIVDDGCGMCEEELLEAMRLGSQSPLDIRDDNDLGRFGLGLKTASLSQCRRLTVATKFGEEVSVRVWDLDVVTEENEWVLLKRGSETVDALIRDKFQTLDHGTIVLWEKIDRIFDAENFENEDCQDAFLSEIRSVKTHIAQTFSDFMIGADGIAISVNGILVEPWDPFMLHSKFTTRLPSETLWGNGSSITVHTYILPHPNKLTPSEFKIYAGPRGWVDQQGFYIYRNKRLIISGEWLFEEIQKKEQYKLARVRVDIGNDVDTEWKIDVKKSVAVPPISLQKELLRIGQAAQRESSRIFKHRGKRLARSVKVEKKFVWHQFVRNGKIGYSINRDHPLVKQALDLDTTGSINSLLELIEETIPVPTIISDYSEKSEQMLSPYEGKNVEAFEESLDRLYAMYINVLGMQPVEAIRQIAGTEPFIYAPELVALYCERKGISYE